MIAKITMRKQKSDLKTFINISFEMFSKLELDMDYFECMWAELMIKLFIDCSDMDAFIDEINSVKSANDKSYFTMVCNKYLTESLHF